MKTLRPYVVAVSIAAAFDAGVHASGRWLDDGVFNKQRVIFRSSDLTLVGYLYRPSGDGPFPAVVWNHGSEANPAGGPQFDSVASIFVPAGYVVFAPVRRGHSDSEGENILVARDREAARNGDAAGRRLMNRLLETSQLQDQLSGLTFLKQQPFVDKDRLVVAGCSFGGIQTLLGAEANVGYRAAISISPAALNWGHNPDLEARLEHAVDRIGVPVFLIQPPKDASLGPARILGPRLERRNRASRVKIYPAEGPENEQQHCFGGAKGMHVWGPDAVAFLKDALQQDAIKLPR
jgi:dienelactone hydrolase